MDEISILKIGAIREISRPKPLTFLITCAIL